jgi:FkbM family methyltransferase
MSIRKAVLAGTLASKRTVKLGDKVFRLKGFFANAIALEHFTQAQEPEPWLDVIFSTVLQCREGAFLDVGANLGQTLFKILALDPARQYVGFEPQLACCFMIQRFLDDNRITNFMILPLGLSNTNRLIKLHSGPGDHDSIASMVDGFRPDSFYSSHRYVSVMKGDYVISMLDLSSICAIKVDVEGAELEVLEGFLTTIEKTKPFLVFEVLNHFLVGTGSRLDHKTIRFRESRIEKMEEMLRELNYEIFNILPGSRIRNVHKIRPPVSDDLSITNYLAVPTSDLDAFLGIFPGQVQRAEGTWGDECCLTRVKMAV